MESTAHCEAHSGVCERIAQAVSSAAAVQARLDAHCQNGGTGHVQRREITALTEDVSTLTADVKQLHEAIQQDRQEHAVQTARRDATTKLLVAAVGAIGVASQYAIAYFLK